MLNTLKALITGSALRWIAAPAVIAITCSVAPTAVQAALLQNMQAPLFTADAALGGNSFKFSMHDALSKGPVVLYFFPAAFTAGCTLEAHAFAEATERFNKLGATVVGITAGNLDRVADFSKLECRNKFAVVADPGAQIAKEYDTQINSTMGLISSRTSYVIAPNGSILMTYTDKNPEAHIQKTMAAVEAWHASHN